MANTTNMPLLDMFDSFIVTRGLHYNDVSCKGNKCRKLITKEVQRRINNYILLRGKKPVFANKNFHTLRLPLF